MEIQFAMRTKLRVTRYGTLTDPIVALDVDGDRLACTDLPSTALQDAADFRSTPDEELDRNWLTWIEGTLALEHIVHRCPPPTVVPTILPEFSRDREVRCPIPITVTVTGPSVIRSVTLLID